MFGRIDRSAFLSRFITYLSNSLARKRGLPIVVGIVLIVIALVVQVIGVFTESQIVSATGIIINGIGLIIALIGLLLAEPLGK
ncbi:MAG: hypothetical protein CUN55_10910 [Phototrophicales bacterium]|nr:MAG: hypothetical protein CUN55_10910 [Phototrophicales bacterium]